LAQREPNGVNRKYFGGGFGPNGDLSFEQTNDLTGQFTPPSDPLYSGLGNSDICDGLERLAAAQRYYYNFFVNKHKINLTFDTAGWVISDKSADSDKIINSGCNDFSNFYPLVENYSDWVSFDFYLHKDNNIESLVKEVDYLRSVNSDKPIIITELGFCDGPNKDSEIEAFMNEVVSNLKEIKALVFWGTSIEGGLEQNSSCPDVSIKPGAGGEKLKEIIDSNSSYFNSCVKFSDQSVELICNPHAVTPQSDDIPEGKNETNEESSCLSICIAEGEVSNEMCQAICSNTEYNEGLENSQNNNSECFNSCMLEPGTTEAGCSGWCSGNR
jgi:hypothetical protein